MTNTASKKLTAKQAALLARLTKARGQRLTDFDGRVADGLIRQGLAQEKREQVCAEGSTAFGRDGSCRYYMARTLILVTE